MELWQLDVVGGFLVADGTGAKALTGIDDHSRFCVSARLMPRERTQPKIERFHRTLRTEFDTTQVFRTLNIAQQALDEWVADYNANGEHSSIGDVAPAARSLTTAMPARDPGQRRPERAGEQWVSRRVAKNGIVWVAYQQVSVGKHYAGSACDVLVADRLLQFWIGSDLVKTVARASSDEIRKKHAARTSERH